MNSQAKPSRMIADKTHNQPPTQQTVLQVKVIDSAEIFRGQNEIMISHDGVIYRMKITRQGKLILNK